MNEIVTAFLQTPVGTSVLALFIVAGGALMWRATKQPSSGVSRDAIALGKIYKETIRPTGRQAEKKEDLAIK